jgi:hypothetical protein
LPLDPVGKGEYRKNREITYEMGHLVEDRASLVVIVIGACGSVLGEAPVSVVGARHDNFGAGDCVQQGTAVAAATVRVRAGDGGRRRLHTLDTVVDALHLGGH